MDDHDLEARRARIKASHYHYVEADPGASEGSLPRLRAEAVEARLRFEEAWKIFREVKMAGTASEEERLHIAQLSEQMVITTKRIREAQERGEA